MFTGLVQATGRVRSISETESGVRIVLDAGGWPQGPQPGESIAVNGVCLTLVHETEAGHNLAFDAVAETLAKTALGGLCPGDEVNLERSLRADSLMGGHFVQGHVDGVGVVRSVTDDPADWRVRVAPPRELMPFMAPKGAVTLDGVSLTLAVVTDQEIEVALIPTTLDRTTLRRWRPAQRINIEADIIAKTVVHWLSRFTGRSQH